MGVWYYIVNAKRRESIKPGTFGDGDKVFFASEATDNLHLFALRWLMVPRFQGHKEPEFRLRGSWVGDPVYTFSDHDEVHDDSPPADQELYQCYSESRDISRAVFLELFKGSSAFSERIFDVLQEERGHYRALVRELESIEIGQLDEHLRIRVAQALETIYLSAGDL